MVSRGRRIEPVRITSRANETYKAVRGLHVGFGGKEILVEGEKLIGEAHRQGLTAKSQWFVDAALVHLNCPAFQVSADMYAALSPTRAGQAPLVVFSAPNLPEPGPGDLGEGRYLLLDRVQDPGNGGALVRAAAAFGFSGVLWRRPCVYPFHHAAIRASAGCVFHLPQWLVDESFSPKLSLIGAAGEAEAVSMDDFIWPNSFILAMGNEGQGLDPALRRSLTHLVRIPMAAGVESLNVAGAAHVLMHDAARQGRSRP